MGETTIDSLLDKAFDDLEIDEKNRTSVKAYLQIVRNRDEETYEHSVRVALKGMEVAELLELDPKALFYAGCLHDVGKAETDPDSLKKKKGFNDKDKKELKKHPLAGYRMLRGIHDFSAEILKSHHVYQKDGYPKNMPKSKVEFSKGTEVMIAYYSRLLGLIDFYDAMSHRKNDKFSPGKPRLPTKEEGKKILLDANKDQERLINSLYDKGIF